MRGCRRPQEETSWASHMLPHDSQFPKMSKSHLGLRETLVCREGC